jgi:antitoxin component of MazEF toxin-antitoxin module
MITSKSRVKRWGNSFGVLIPKEMVEKEGLKEGEEVGVSVVKTSDIKHLFGKYPFRDLQKQKEKMKEGWD